MYAAGLSAVARDFECHRISGGFLNFGVVAEMKRRVGGVFLATLASLGSEKKVLRMKERSFRDGCDTRSCCNCWNSGTAKITSGFAW